MLDVREELMPIERGVDLGTIVNECGGCNGLEVEIEEVSSAKGELCNSNEGEPELVDSAGVN